LYENRSEKMYRRVPNDSKVSIIQADSRGAALITEGGEWTTVGAQYSKKIKDQMANAGLPQVGPVPFEPRVVKNKSGEDEIDKKAPLYGRRKNKKGFVDVQGRIWIKDWAHSGYPNHWDVQVDSGQSYFRVDYNGVIL
jgi:hypothetical protein